MRYEPSDNAVDRRRGQCLLLSARGHPVTQLTTDFQVRRLPVTTWFTGWQTPGLPNLRHRPGQARQAPEALVEVRKA